MQMVLHLRSHEKLLISFFLSIVHNDKIEKDLSSKLQNCKRFYQIMFNKMSAFNKTSDKLS